MATKLKHQHDAKPAGNQESPGNVIALVRCCAEGCNKRAELTNFCKEHYDWFKFGLVTKEGKKPSDFDKKYQSFKKNRAA